MISTFIVALGSFASSHVSLLMMLAKATIILIAALGITVSMQRASAGARHLVWLVTLGMLLLPALSTWAPLPLRILPAATSDVGAVPSLRDDPSGAASAERRSADGAAIRIPAAQTSLSERATWSPLSRIRGMSGISLLLTIWAVVVAGIAIMLTWASLTVRRIVRRARPLDSQDWVAPLFEIADRLGLEQSPRLLQSADARMPFACGVLEPTIVLPAESESWSLDRRRAVLLHELAHVRRHDLLGHALARLVCAVYWFHPLVWTAAKRLRSESERACDDLALACGTRATDYAEHLLDIVTSVRGDATPLVALAMARRKEFEGRMLAILDPDLRHSTPSRKQSAALIGALGLVSLIVGAASPIARRADAAVVAAVPQRTALPQAVSNAFAQSESHVVSTRQSQSERAASTSSERAFQAIVEAGTTIGSNAAASALEGLTNAKLGKGAKGEQGLDERATLLAKVLRTDSSASLRRIAAWGLREYADSPEAEEALAGAIRRDVDAGVREMAAWALGNGERRTSGATQALLAALKRDADEKVRTTAAWALGNAGDRASVEDLAAALSDPSDRVRMRAAWALGNVEPKQAPKQLVALLKDTDPHVRELAAWALYNIQDPSTAPALETALKVERDKEVQLAFLRSIATLGEKSVDAIRGLLESPDPRIRAMAVHALAGGQAAEPWPWPWPDPRPFP